MNIKNVTGRCVDKNSPRDSVMHEVEFDLETPDGWEHKVVQLMALDPMDAIKSILKEYK